MKPLTVFLAVVLHLLITVPSDAQVPKWVDAKKIDQNFYYRLQSGTTDSEDYGFLTMLEGWSQPGLTQKLESHGQLWRFEYMGSSTGTGDSGYRVTNGLFKDMSLEVMQGKTRLGKTHSDNLMEALLPINHSHSEGAEGLRLRSQLWYPMLFGQGEDDDCIMLSVGLIGNLVLEYDSNKEADKRLHVKNVNGFQGDDSTKWILTKTNIPVEPVQKFQLTSTSFVNRGNIPDKYAGENGSSPPLAWTGAPEGTKSFMLLCTDPDAPSPLQRDPNPFVHWFVVNIPADTTYLLPSVPAIPELSTPFGAIQLPNSAGTIGYFGPEPPKGPRHRYYFMILALDRVLDLNLNQTPEHFMQLVADSTLGTAQLMGYYETRNQSNQGSLPDLRNGSSLQWFLSRERTGFVPSVAAKILNLRLHRQLPVILRAGCGHCADEAGGIDFGATS